MRQFIKIILITIIIALTFVSSIFAEKVNDTKPLNIRVVTAIYEPFVMYKEGKLVGYDIDLLNEICKNKNINYTITVTTFQDMLLQVKNGRADMAIGCIYVTEEREELFNFSESYLEGGLALVVSPQSTVRTVYDLEHMTLGVKKDASGDKYAMSLLKQGYSINVVRFQNTIDSFDALVNGRVDAVLNDFLNSVYLLNKYFAGNIKITKGNWGDIVYDRKKIAFPVAVHNKDLLKIISDSIHELKSQNFTDMLYWKWFAIMPPPDIPKRIIFYASAVVLTILFSFLIVQLYIRKKRIHELQMLESHFRNLINDLNVGVYILQKNKIVLTNYEGARIASASFENIIGKTLDEYFKEYFIKDEISVRYSSFFELQKALQHTHYIKQGVWQRKDNSSLTVLFRIRPVIWMGQQVVECVVNDTTEITHLLTQHEQLKGQLLQSQKLEIIGQIAGGIAHDFNNILTVILGYANLVEKSIDDKHKPAVGKIIQAGSHAKDLVSKLMTFARKKAFNAVELKVHTIIQNAISLLHTAFSKNSEVALSLYAHNDIIMGDPTEIQQVIMNLILNAAEAMPQGGTIIIQTENITLVNEKSGIIETIPAGDYICITVKDTGTGIAPEHLEHIFEPLYTTKENGSGLGLAIVWGIIKQHKGFIDVISIPGTGTSFFIYLPVVKSKILIEKNHDNNELQESNGTVIIIDDDENICTLYQEALEIGEFKAITFTDPKGALKYIDNHSNMIKLVISDVRMPVLSGEDVLAYIKRNHPGIKVIMVSGYYDEIMKEKLLQMGAYDVWPKMFDIHEIVNKVRGVINRYGTENIIRS